MHAPSLLSRAHSHDHNTGVLAEVTRQFSEWAAKEDKRRAKLENLLAKRRVASTDIAMTAERLCDQQSQAVSSAQLEGILRNLERLHGDGDEGDGE